jgi:hypothetical protein
MQYDREYYLEKNGDVNHLSMTTLVLHETDDGEDYVEFHGGFDEFKRTYPLFYKKYYEDKIACKVLVINLLGKHQAVVSISDGLTMNGVGKHVRDSFRKHYNNRWSNPHVRFSIEDHEEGVLTVYVGCDT